MPHLIELENDGVSGKAVLPYVPLAYISPGRGASGIQRGNSFCRLKNGIRILNAANEQSYALPALLLTLRERPFLTILLAYEAELV